MKKQFQALLLIISILFSIIPQDVASADADLVQSQGTTVSKNETTQKTTFPVHVIHKAGDDHGRWLYARGTGQVFAGCG